MGYLEVVGFILMAIVAVVCAIAMISTRNPVHSALWLVCCFVSLAVIYLILAAPLLFAVQLIVYAGAIMILFLFVIMFFMAPSARQWLRPPLKGQLVFGGIFVVLFALLLSFGFVLTEQRPPMQTLVSGEYSVTDSERGQGDPKPLGAWLFKYHVLPFELTSILLLAALLGAMMVARDVKQEGRSDFEPFAAVIEDEEDEAAEEVEA